MGNGCGCPCKWYFIGVGFYIHIVSLFLIPVRSKESHPQDYQQWLQQFAPGMVQMVMNQLDIYRQVCSITKSVNK